jgi:hypothetical protein
MPVKTFIAGFCTEDWSTGHAHSFSEVIKARNKKDAEEQARAMSLEMGPDTMLMNTTAITHVSMPRLEDRYNKWMRRQQRPAQYRYRYDRRRRRA